MTHYPHRRRNNPPTGRDVQGLWIPDGMGNVLTEAAKAAAVLMLEFKHNNADPLPASAPEAVVNMPVETLVERVMKNATQYRVLVMGALTDGMFDIFNQLSNGKAVRKTDILIRPDQIASGQEALSALAAAKAGLLAKEEDVPEGERTPDTRKVAMVAAFAGKVAKEISEARKRNLQQHEGEKLADAFQNLSNESSVMQMAIEAKVKDAMRATEPLKAMDSAIAERRKMMESTPASAENMKIMVRTLELTRKVVEQTLQIPQQQKT